MNCTKIQSARALLLFYLLNLLVWWHSGRPRFRGLLKVPFSSVER